MYQIYQIKPNETLDMIAKKINVSLDELKKINGITNNSYIRPGGYIIIPNNMMNNNMGINNMPITNNIPGNYKRYIVKPGDSLYQIAKQNNIDLNTLIALNGLKKEDFIYPNQEILIPNNNMYIVKEKETIKDIMEKLNLPINSIENLYLESDQIINY